MSAPGPWFAIARHEGSGGARPSVLALTDAAILQAPCPPDPARGRAALEAIGRAGAAPSRALVVPRGAVLEVAHTPAYGRVDEATDLLEFVGLSHRATVAAGSLSYGEQRMLELARALATGPRLLMVDEPAAGLNNIEAELLLDRLVALRERGMAVILIEHNMDLVTRVADHVMVMNHGQLLFAGTPSAMQSDPAVIDAYLGVELE